MPGPIIDMTPQGDFQQRSATPLSMQVLRVAVMVAILAGALAIAAFALWIALLLIPVAITAAIVGWLAWRWRVWRLRTRGASGSNLYYRGGV